jgi:hypothetical protein
MNAARTSQRTREKFKVVGPEMELDYLESRPSNKFWALG